MGRNKKTAPAKRGRVLSGKPRDKTVIRAHEHAFAMAFLQTQCAKKAAKLSGIRGKSLSSACTFLKRPGVQRIINEEMKMRGKTVGITVDRVLNELAALAFTSMGDFAAWSDNVVRLTPSSELTRTQARAVQSVSSKMSAQGVPNVTIKLYDKTKALEVLARYLGIIGPEADGNSRPQAQELALRIREFVTKAGEQSGDEAGSQKPLARKKPSAKGRP